ncbi:DUF2785 domain-containing protein [Sutcliffiella halmapala]|uniref:DUF2785 domain-containing protein n=1 Tax=Sutcliffiella halmapala TaxID=79882 RepID=UPI0009953ADA|nr:DUF2785 domain-containing protein [Sutcliffiella halmapala]
MINVISMKESELKTVLKEYKPGTQTWNEGSKRFLVNSMITHIGSTDSELRDDLIYSSFCTLVLENQLEHELLNELLDCCLSNSLLFKGIGENGSDSVFTRSFTTLVIALILYKDNEADSLSQSKVYQVKDKLIQYINSENDLRGYVTEKGWAHSIAHVSDAFAELVKNRKVEQNYYIEILKALWNKIYVYNSVYVHDEDERILIPIIEMLQNGLKIEEVVNLVQHIPAELKTQKEQIAEEQYWYLVANCKTFLKSFYIKINTNSNFLSLQKKIEKCLAEI